MLHIEKWKIIFVLIISLLGVAYAVPNILPATQQAWLQANVPSWLPSKTVNLGLDLRGGSHLLLEADTKKVFTQRIDAMEDGARSSLRRDGISFTDMQTVDNGISFKLVDLGKDRDSATKIARDLEENTDVAVAEDGTVSAVLTEVGIKAINKSTLSKSIEVIRRRIDETGTKEPLIQQQGDSRIVVQVPGVENPDDIKALLGKTGEMSFHLLDENAGTTGELSAGSMRVPFRDRPGQMIAIKKRAAVLGDKLVDSQPTFDRDGSSVVSFRFNSVGSKQFCDITTENIDKPFAIKLDKEVISAPVIRSAICGGTGQISGNFTTKEANDLSLMLRAGALPAPLKIVEERSVGPTLGSDSIAAGKHAAIVAFVLVFAGMAAIYGLFGFFANIALFLNIVFILAVLSMLQATLTLPGIAGIILTIGIAVDANVLIYERIREELRQGRTVLSAVDTGYKLALHTIIDANLTTLIVAFILFSFGSGPIKGFAVAMCIGIITSMFSAIMLTRLMVLVWLKKNRPTSLPL